MKKRYEFVFVLPGKLEKEKTEEEKKKLRTLFSDHDASVVEEVEWGKKDLAYPIKHEHTGYYAIWTVESVPSSLGEISRLLNFQANVLRYTLLQVIS